ncbi:MAG: glycosyltransferase family 4 protein [Leptolyngbyaceae cyanobacterium]
MRVAIVRRALNASFSMDVYADGLVKGLREVRPEWSIVELTPAFAEYRGSLSDRASKYYQRYWAWPQQLQRQADIDLFHVVDHSDGHLVYGLRHQQRRVIVTCHDLINYRQPENIRHQAKLPLISTWIWRYAVRGIRQADHIVTVSHHTAKDVMAIFDVAPDCLKTAHNGIDSQFQPLPQRQIEAVRSRYNLAAQTFCLLNVGSNHPRKNIFTVLKVLNALHHEGHPVHFLKAGADFTNEQKSYISQQNLTDWVTYVGKPDKAELVQLYNAVDVLVAPSLYEGFGITPVEAMACGTPVIASNTTALPEVVGHAGILVPPNDIPAIAAAVKRLQQDPIEYQKLVLAGCDRARLFTWQLHAESVAAVYENTLESIDNL